MSGVSSRSTIWSRGGDWLIAGRDLLVAHLGTVVTERRWSSESCEWLRQAPSARFGGRGRRRRADPHLCGGGRRLFGLQRAPRRAFFTENEPPCTRFRSFYHFRYWGQKNSYFSRKPRSQGPDRGTAVQTLALVFGLRSPPSHSRQPKNPSRLVCFVCTTGLCCNLGRTNRHLVAPVPNPLSRFSRKCTCSRGRGATARPAIAAFFPCTTHTSVVHTPVPVELQTLRRFSLAAMIHTHSSSRSTRRRWQPPRRPHRQMGPRRWEHHCLSTLPQWV